MSFPGRVLLGVDAGGTKTDVLIVGSDATRAASTPVTVLASVRGRAGNHEAIGWAAAQTALGDTLERALCTAGVAPGEVVASAWGVSGLDWPADEAGYRRIIAGLGFGEPTMVANDAYLALELGPAAGSGVALVSGTGAVAVGRAPGGEMYRTLGVGAGHGDSGSGGDVVRWAAEAVAQQHMGTGPATALTGRALAAAGVATASDYCEQVWRHGRAHLLPPDVWEVAAAGDPVAAAIADRVADSLAVAAVAVARRLGLHGCEVRLAGRVLDPGHPVLHDRLVAALAERLPGGRPRRLGRPPVVGAVLAAARACGLPERHLNAIMSCLTPPVLSPSVVSPAHSDDA